MKVNVTHFAGFLPVVSGARGPDNSGMSEAWIRGHWALLGAGAAILAVLVVLLVTAYRGSRRGRLAGLVRQRKKERRALAAAVTAEKRAKGRVERLEKKAQRVAPRTLDEARGALSDARRLVEVRAGALQVAENHLRKIILEEFPPGRHDGLRRRYGVSEQPGNRPFTFDGS